MTNWTRRIAGAATASALLSLVAVSTAPPALAAKPKCAHSESFDLNSREDSGGNVRARAAGTMKWGCSDGKFHVTGKLYDLDLNDSKGAYVWAQACGYYHGKDRPGKCRNTKDMKYSSRQGKEFDFTVSPRAKSDGPTGAWLIGVKATSYWDDSNDAYKVVKA
ncbi:hypothetical protein NLX83_23405 [Allokutzneria sp. A3M-2-11 16]|uniref:hypothetical protein n=1 Tax=Allokutzneria sp. A3M-2-11 16 TaxID=2962043 RepID=UPI0020B87835|nr:hypothetical protein [Allokutzneria sp. A3M-2-11 16]MCP3802220.1 hypothetical protein [Allokutzneria sp. A3M-2-11 16]